MGKKSLNTSETGEALDASHVETGLSYEEKLKFVNRIAKPMASRKLAKKLMKMIKKGIEMALLFVCFSFLSFFTSLVHIVICLSTLADYY